MAKELVTRTLKFKVTLTVTVDPDAVNAEYGNDDSDGLVADFIADTLADGAKFAVAHIPGVAVITASVNGGPK